jgi:hypothetical protein
MTAGFLLSVSTLIDCQLVHVTWSEGGVDPFLATLVSSSSSSSNHSAQQTHSIHSSNTTHLGLFFVQDENGNCAFYLDNHTDYSLYLEFMDEAGWGRVRCLAVYASILSLMVTIWLYTWACCAHSRLWRRFWMASVGLLLVGLQLGALVTATQLCREEEENCRLGRAAGWSVLATGLYAVAAVAVGRGSRHSPPADRLPHRDWFQRENGGCSSSSSTEQQQRVGNTSLSRIVPRIEDGVGDAQEVPISPSCIQAMFANAGGDGTNDVLAELVGGSSADDTAAGSGTETTTTTGSTGH